MVPDSNGDFCMSPFMIKLTHFACCTSELGLSTVITFTITECPAHCYEHDAYEFIYLLLPHYQCLLELNRYIIDI